MTSQLSKPETAAPRELIEREAVLLALTIIMLPDHAYLFDQVEPAILRLPARFPAQQTLSADVTCMADVLDDIEVDANGKCHWTDVANRQSILRATLRQYAMLRPKSGAWRSAGPCICLDGKDGRLGRMLFVLREPQGTSDVPTPEELNAYAQQIVAAVNCTTVSPQDSDLTTGLKAAIRAAKLALFVIRKQDVMPNSSWQSGFDQDLATAEAALAAPKHSQEENALNDFSQHNAEIVRLTALVETKPLWCCHVRGPDDVYAAPDYETALKWADMLNETNFLDPPGHQKPQTWDECLVKAAPAIWPWTPEAHAENLPKSIAGFALPSDERA